MRLCRGACVSVVIPSVTVVQRLMLCNPVLWCAFAVPGSRPQEKGAHGGKGDGEERDAEPPDTGRDKVVLGVALDVHVRRQEPCIALIT